MILQLIVIAVVFHFVYANTDGEVKIHISDIHHHTHDPIYAVEIRKIIESLAHADPASEQYSQMNEVQKTHGMMTLGRMCSPGALRLALNTHKHYGVRIMDHDLDTHSCTIAVPRVAQLHELN